MRAAAIASIEPIIQASGRRSTANTAPAAMQIASAFAAGAMRESFKGSGYGRAENAIISCFTARGSWFPARGTVGLTAW